MHHRRPQPPPETSKEHKGNAKKSQGKAKRKPRESEGRTKGTRANPKYSPKDSGSGFVNSTQKQSVGAYPFWKESPTRKESNPRDGANSKELANWLPSHKVNSPLHMVTWPKRVLQDCQLPFGHLKSSWLSTPKKKRNKREKTRYKRNPSNLLKPSSPQPPPPQHPQTLPNPRKPPPTPANQRSRWFCRRIRLEVPGPHGAPGLQRLRMCLWRGHVSTGHEFGGVYVHHPLFRGFLLQMHGQMCSWLRDGSGSRILIESAVQAAMEGCWWCLVLPFIQSVLPWKVPEKPKIQRSPFGTLTTYGPIQGNRKVKRSNKRGLPNCPLRFKPPKQHACKEYFCAKCTFTPIVASI